jgi:hypothetical protein
MSGTPDKQIQSLASKAKNVIDYVESKFLEFYSPTQYLSAHESSVNFKVCVVFKIYNPQKPTNWGRHVYVIADSTNGYDCDLIPYYVSTTTKTFDGPRANIPEQNCSRSHKQDSKRNT